MNERVQKFNTNLKDAITEAKKMADIDDKMKEIESSLNEDEKKEFKKLGLLNDDENGWIRKIYWIFEISCAVNWSSN